MLSHEPLVCDRPLLMLLLSPSSFLSSLEWWRPGYLQTWLLGLGLTLFISPNYWGWVEPSSPWPWREVREQLTRRGKFQVAWQLLNCLVLCSPEWFPSRIVTTRDELGQDRCVHAKWTKSRLFCGEHEKRENSGLLLLFSHVPSVRGGTFNTTQCIFVLPFFTSFFFS